MTLEKKQEIVHNLLQVPDNSLMGTFIKNFIDNLQGKSDEDLKRLVDEIKDNIPKNPELMQSVLGETYDYFNQLSIQ